MAELSSASPGLILAIYLDLILLDAETGQVVFAEEGLLLAQLPISTLFLALLPPRPSNLLPFSYSADGNTLLIGPSNDKLAFDLRTRTPIKLGGNLKNDVDGTYAFLGNDRIAAINGLDPPHTTASLASPMAAS